VVRRAILLACLPLVLSSCGNDSNGPNGACNGQVQVDVTAGVTPEFTWHPACAVSNLIVLAGVGPHPFEQANPNWYVESQPDAQQQPTNGLHGGIHFGEIPPGARQLTATIPLVQGQPYTVYLNVYTSDQGVTNVGNATFTP
jgi:hypothetical protein